MGSFQLPIITFFPARYKNKLSTFSISCSVGFINRIRSASTFRQKGTTMDLNLRNNHIAIHHKFIASTIEGEYYITTNIIFVSTTMEPSSEHLAKNRIKIPSVVWAWRHRFDADMNTFLLIKITSFPFPKPTTKTFQDILLAQKVWSHIEQRYEATAS